MRLFSAKIYSAMKKLKIPVTIMISIMCAYGGSNNMMALNSLSPTSTEDCFDVPHSLCYGVIITPDDSGDSSETGEGPVITVDYGSNYALDRE